MEYEVESTRCVDCGIDTMKNGYVNRCHYNDNIVDAYHCGVCQTNIEWYIYGDSEYENCETDEDIAKVDKEIEKYGIPMDEEGCEEYLEERIKEVDKVDPEAKTFRKLCQSVSDCF